MSESADSRSALWRGLLIGGVVGAMVGALLAPQEGDRVRRELKERFGELATVGAAIGGLVADVAVDTASAVAQELGGVAQRLRSEAPASHGRLAQVLRIGNRAARDEVDRLNQEYSALEDAPPEKEPE